MSFIRFQNCHHLGFFFFGSSGTTSTVSRIISFSTVGFGVGREDAVVEDGVRSVAPFHKAGDLIELGQEFKQHETELKRQNVR